MALPQVLNSHLGRSRHDRARCAVRQRFISLLTLNFACAYVGGARDDASRCLAGRPRDGPERREQLMIVTQQRKQPLVVVADDDEMQRFLFREALEASGFDMVEACDGDEGVDAAARVQPDLVVLDVVMPRMDGFKACAAIRELPDCIHTPIPMATGLDDVAAVEQAYDVGATDFIAKPINWTLLGHRLRYMHRANRAFSEVRFSRQRLAKAEAIACLGSWEWDNQSGQLDCSD